jgi:hypothetical protein
MFKEYKWNWSWPNDAWLYVSHSYWPLTLILIIGMLSPDSVGRWAGHVVLGFKSVH